MIDLVNDILFGAVLQPVLDLVGNPAATANVLIGLAFHPSPTRTFEPGSGKKVELLKKFGKAHQSSLNSVSLDLLSSAPKKFQKMKFSGIAYRHVDYFEE